MERKVPSDEQLDDTREERYLLESRKRKDAHLKKRARIPLENERKLRERELECQEENRKIQTDRPANY